MVLLSCSGTGGGIYVKLANGVARRVDYAEWIDKLDGAGYGLGQCANRASPTRGKGNIPPVFV
jgi:hypothetical protein